MVFRSTATTSLGRYLVLLNTFHGHIPFFKFFLKRQLFKIPITRHAWWALDYPSWTVIPRSFIEKTPI